MSKFISIDFLDLSRDAKFLYDSTWNSVPESSIKKKGGGGDKSAIAPRRGPITELWRTLAKIVSVAELWLLD